MGGRAAVGRTVLVICGVAGAMGVAPATASAQSADLSVTKSESADPVDVGAEFAYEIAVANAGPDAAAGVSVTDTLPNEVDFVSAATSQGGCEQQGAKRVVCELGSLASGAAATVTIRVRAAQGGEAVNTVKVESPTTDPTPANNEATARTTVREVPVPSCAGQEVTIAGTAASETLTGTDKRDVIAGLGGDDVILGLDGADVICGGRGVDTIRAGGDDDLVKGGGDADVIRGNGEHDTLRGNGGDDVLRGGAGNDTLRGGPGLDTCAGGRGRDTRSGCE